MENSKIFNEAKRLHGLGFALIHIHQKSKRPVASGWTTGERLNWAQFEKGYQAGQNIGVRLGEASKIGENYLTCLDLDIKDPAFREIAVKKLNEVIGDKRYPSVVSGGGNGSRHLYCVSPEPIKMITVHKEEGWELCIYSTGRQMVLPPSIHPDSGRAYKWAVPLSSIHDLPLRNFSHLQSVKKEKKNADTNKRDLHSAVSEFKFSLEDVELDWLPISDHVREQIMDGKGVTDRSGALLPISTALMSAGLSSNQVLNVLTDPKTFIGRCSLERRGSRASAAEWVYRYTLQKVEGERSGKGVFDNLVEIAEEEMTAEEEKELLGPVNWKQKLDRGKNGPLVTLKNLDLIFTNEVEGIVFKKDLFANRIAYGVDTPWGGKSDEYIQDIDMVLVKRWLSDTEFGIEPNTNAILEATNLVAHRCAVHPVRDWLESLNWDGKKRCDTWIRDYCEGEAEEPYLSQVSRKFLVAMVKRVFRPGCQWDYVLVLEGKQGKYKSSIARALASDRWFMDNLPDLKDKDAMLNLQGKWLIELPELASVKRVDYNLVKAYLTRRSDTVRPHYGRIVADVPRQSAFIGTVNEGQYFKDPTGNRRYWPVKVHDCDVKGLTAVRDQLFAEAMYWYKEGEVLMLDPAATVQANDAQEDRKIEDDSSEMKDALSQFMKTEAAIKIKEKPFRARDLFNGEPWVRWAQHRYGPQLAAEILHSAGFKRGTGRERRRWNWPENRRGDGPRDGPEKGVRHRKKGSVTENDINFN